MGLSIDKNRKQCKTKRFIALIMATVFFSLNFSNITAKAASLSLSAYADPSNGKVKLTVSGGTSGSSYRFFVYNNGDWETISAYNYETLNSKVNVLNVYPTKDGDGKSLGDSQRNALSDKINYAGKQKINVIPVSINNFNSKPCDYLYKKNGTWYTTGGVQVDAIYFGSYDGYGKHNDISDVAHNGSDDLGDGYSAVTRVKIYIDDKGSVLFGHDCVFPSSPTTNFWDYFHDELGLSKASGLLTNIPTDKEGNKYPDSKGNTKYRCPLNIVKNNSTTMMTMPNDLRANNLKAYYTHSTNCAVKKDNVFVEFTSDDGCFFNMKSTISMFQESSLADPTRNFYVAGNGTGHVFQTQVGHNKGGMSDDEARLLANMFFYLKQTTTESFDYYYDAQDKAAPNKPSISKKLSGNNYNFSFDASDNGTSYMFKAENTSSSGTSQATSSCSYATGVDHYIYKVDSFSGTTISSGTTSYGNTSLSISNVANKYLHVAAVDKAGNVGPTATEYIEVKPDLTITNITTKNSNGYSTSYFDGKETAEISINIENQGAADANSCHLRLTGPFSSETVYIPAIKAGNSYTKTVTVKMDNEDTTSRVWAYVDYNDEIDESNENNNSYDKTIYVTEKNPDLTITNIATKDSNNYGTSYFLGTDEATVSVTVKNKGNDDAGSCAMQVTGPFETQTIRVPALDAGETTTIDVPVTFYNRDAYPGTISAFVDYYDTIEELNENNNTYDKTVYVSEKNPDLTITSLNSYRNDISTTTFKPEVDAKVQVVVKNRGTDYAGPCKLRITGPFGIQEQPIPGLSCGQSTTITFEGLKAPAELGNYTLTAYADCDNEITELSESNNTSSKIICIEYPYPVLDLSEIKGNSYKNGNNYWFSMQDTIMINQQYRSNDLDTDLTEQNICLTNNEDNAFRLNLRANEIETNKDEYNNAFTELSHGTSGDIQTAWQGFVNLRPNTEGKYLYNTGAYLEFNEDKKYYNGKELNSTNQYVCVDGTAPVITISQSPDKWTNGNVVITGSATDLNGSGVKNISINNNLSSSSSKNYTVTKNGQYKVVSEDNVGNVKEETAIITNIDKLNPEINSVKYKVISDNGNTIKVKVIVDAKDADETEDYGSSGLKTVTVTVNGTKYNASLNDKTGKYEAEVNIVKNSIANVKTEVTDNAGNVVSKTDKCDDGKITTSATIENYNYFDSSKKIYWVNAKTQPLIKTVFNMSANYYEKFIANENIVVKKSTNGIYNGTYNNIAEIYNNHDDNEALINQNKCSAVTDCANEDIIGDTDISGDAMVSRNINFALNLKDDTFYKVQAYYNDSVQDITDKYSNITYPFIIGYDSIKPSTEYTKSTENWTNGNVSVTYKYSDKGSGIKAFTINNVNQSKNSVSGSTSKTYTTNGIYKYKVEDNVGNITEDDIEITNIDKLQPFISSLDCVRNEDGTTRVYIGAFDALATDQYGCSGVKDVYVNSTGYYKQATLDEALGVYYYDITTPANKSDRTITIKIIDNAGNTKIETKTIKQPKLSTSATIENYNYFDKSKNIYWVNADTNPLVKAQFNLSENTYNENIANINLAVLRDKLVEETSEEGNSTTTSKTFNEAEAYNNYSSDQIEINKDKCSATLNSEKTEIIDENNTKISGNSKTQRNFDLSLDFIDEGIYRIKPYYNMLEMKDDYLNASTSNGEYNFKIGYDKTKPATENSFSTKEWTNKDVTVTYKYKDEGSGVKNISLDDTAQTVSSNGVLTKTYSANGVHKYEVTDNVDNVQTDYIEIANIDKLKPIIDPHVETEITKEGKTKLIIDAKDADETTENGCSGIKNVTVTISGQQLIAEYNEQTMKYEVEIPVSNTSTNSFVITVTDNAGNNVSLSQSIASDLTITNLEGKNSSEFTDKGNILASGFDYSLAIGNNYKLYSWGNNTNGQLATGNTSSRRVPEKTSTNLDFQQVASGYYHGLAIGDDLNLYAWGKNSDGQLGNNSTSSRTTPIKINLASGVKPKAISANGNNSMAIGTNNKLYTWGDNSCGQLGNNSTADRKIPTQINLPNNVNPVAISSGYQHSMAIGEDGILYAWGDNSCGQLGIGKDAEDGHVIDTDTKAANTTTKYIVSRGTNFDLRGEYEGKEIRTTFADGGYATVLKVGSQTSNVSGMHDTELDGVIISTKIDIVNNNHYAKISYTVKNANTSSRIIGIATHSDVQIGGNDCAPIEKTSDGKGFTMTGDGFVYRFVGKHNYGVTDVDTYWFGHYTERQSNMWNQITSSSLTGIDSGMAFSWQNRTLKAGETKTYSVLIGIGSIKNPTQNTPKQVPMITNNGSKVPFKAKKISAGNNHSMAIGEDGELYTWGDNSYGQLGNGNKVTKYTPEKISLPNNIKVKAISAGGSYSMAIGEDGELYTWGDNSYGQLGNGNTMPVYTPKKITLATGVKPVSILAGQNGHSMAIGNDGNLYVWGYNDNYQLGLGNTINVTKPVRINLATGVKPFANTISDDSSSRMKAVKTRDEYTINGTVANIDKLTNAPCKLTVTYEDGTVVGSVNIPAIQENGEYKFSLKAIAPNKEGVYTLYAKVDSENIIQESNENNNVATMQIVVSNSPADLTVSGLSIKHNNVEVDSSKSGYNDTISGLILNIGDSSSTACKGQIVDQDGKVIADLDIPALQPDGSYVFTKTFTEPLEADEYELTVTADVEDTVIERNENNNSRSISVKVIGLPDLQVKSLNIKEETDKYITDTEYTVQGTIINDGHGDSIASKAKIIDSTGKVIKIISVPALKNKETYDFTVTIKTPKDKGLYTITAYADYTNIVEEIDETNNEKKLELDVKPKLNLLGLSCTKRVLGIDKVDTTVIKGPTSQPVDVLAGAENTLQVDCEGADLVELSFYIGDTKIDNMKFTNTNSEGFVQYNGTIYNSNASLQDGDNTTDNKVTMKVADNNKENKINVTFVLPDTVKDGSVISVKTTLYNKTDNLINNELGDKFFKVKSNLNKMWNINNIR